MIADLRKKNPSQWYSSLKRISGYDKKSENILIQEINHSSDQEQAEKIAEYFSSIPNEYEPLKTKDIKVPPVSQDEIFQFHPIQVKPSLDEDKNK